MRPGSIRRNKMSTTFDVESAPAARWTPAAAGLIARLFEAWRTWRSARQQTERLSALSDHQLRDIGFCRDHTTNLIVRRP
jgi:uncharacterized protein YjiS (DUF1127 family)